jgi:YfiH family protein
VLTRIERNGVAVLTDESLRARSGIVVAFSERGGGASIAPYESLNLAQHVDDDPDAVNENRRRLLNALGVDRFAAALTTAEQVHGDVVAEIDGSLAGSGALAAAGRGPVSGADALWTREACVPLMLFFADCVPVVLVSESPRAVAVVHAGWRGALAGIVGRSAAALGEALGSTGGLTAYVGPHIGACCYEVAPEIVSQFANMFVTIPRASGHLDLGAVVAEDLDRAGVSRERQWHPGICTAHNTDRYYSYRAEGRTGRHAAFAMLEPRSHS